MKEEIKRLNTKALEQDFNEILKELKIEEHKILLLNLKINKVIEYIKRKNLETKEVTHGNIKYILEILEDK